MDHAFAGWVLLTDIPYMKAGSEHHIVCLLAPQPLASAVPEACMLRQSGLVYIERMRLDGEKQFKHALAGSMWIRPGASGNAAGAAALISIGFSRDCISRRDSPPMNLEILRR